MFGLGFGEILVIITIAVIFLGPDKLPEAMIQMAKFFKSVKNTLSDAKESIEHELKVDELKKDVLEYKNRLEDNLNDIKQQANIYDPHEVKNLFDDATNFDKPKIDMNERQTVSFQESLKTEKKDA